MRFGPPPRITTFLRSDGAASFDELAGERRLIGRIHVGGRRGEFGRAGVDALEHRPHIERMALLRDRPRSDCPVSLASRASEKPIAFRRRNAPGVVGKPLVLICCFGLDDAADLLRGTTDRSCSFRGSARRPDAEPHRLRDFQQTVRRRRAERRADRVLVVAFCPRPSIVDVVEPGQAGFQRAQAPSAAIPGKCGRSPSLRRPTSSRWSAHVEAPGNFSKAKRGILVTT